MRRQAIFIASLIAAWGLASAHSDPVPAETREVTVLVHGFAALDSSVHEGSRVKVDRILQPVGPRITWVDCRRGSRVLNAERCESPRRDDVFLRFADGRQVGHLRLHGSYLGLTDPDWAGRGMVTMLLNNIETLRRGTSWQSSTLLAYAIAHGFGLLFGKLEHSTAGLMSADWTNPRLRRITEIGLAMSSEEVRKFRHEVLAHSARQPRPQLASTGSEPASASPSRVSAPVARSTN